MADDEKANGKLLMLRLGDANDPEVFETACGIKDKNFTINNETVDRSLPNYDDPSAPLSYSGGYGLRTISVSGSGFAVSKPWYNRIARLAVEQSAANAQIIVPYLATFTGTVLITSLDISGPAAGDMEFSIDLTMSGDITSEWEEGA